MHPPRNPAPEGAEAAAATTAVAMANPTGMRKSITDLKYSPSPIPPKRNPMMAAVTGFLSLRAGGRHEGGLIKTVMAKLLFVLLCFAKSFFT